MNIKCTQGIWASARVVHRGAFNFFYARSWSTWRRRQGEGGESRKKQLTDKCTLARESPALTLHALFPTRSRDSVCVGTEGVEERGKGEMAETDVLLARYWS